jgi:hypothetical protein
MERRYDIDWLRVGATLLLFVFHAGMIFNPAPFYHIRNDELSFGWLVVCGFISLWHMPLFFLLAGWSLCGSLRTRGSAGVLNERSLRLLVPLLFGCVLFMPVIKYLELSSGLDLNHVGLRVSPALQDGFRLVIPDGLPVAKPFGESFREFLPTFFTLERFTWAHLWFVAYLLTFTLLYLPAFALPPSPIERTRARLGARRLRAHPSARARAAPAAPALAGDPEPLQRLGECRVLHDVSLRGLCSRAIPGRRRGRAA